MKKYAIRVSQCPVHAKPDFKPVRQNSGPPIELYDGDLHKWRCVLCEQVPPVQRDEGRRTH